MSFPKPVPSKAALNALRGLVFTTSCSVVLLAEERRQRTKVARAAIDNARKLHTLKARRNSVPLVDARAPDVGVDGLDGESTPRRRKRRKEQPTERSRSAEPDTHARKATNGVEVTECPNHPLRKTPNRRIQRHDVWPADARGLPQERHTSRDEQENGCEKRSRKSNKTQFLDTSSWTPVVQRGSATTGGANYFMGWGIPLWGTIEQMADHYNLESTPSAMTALGVELATREQGPRPPATITDWYTPIWGTTGEMDYHYDGDPGEIPRGWSSDSQWGLRFEPLSVPGNSTYHSDIEWGTPYWGSQEDAATYSNGKTESLDPSDVAWGLPYSNDESMSVLDSLIPGSDATPEDKEMRPETPGLQPPESYHDLWTSLYSASRATHGVQGKLYRLFRRLGGKKLRGKSLLDHELLARVKFYLLYSPFHGNRSKALLQLSGFRVSYHRLCRRPTERLTGTQNFARGLIHALWFAAQAIDAKVEVASHYLTLAVAVLRKLYATSPSPESEMPTRPPVGIGVLERLLQLAIARDPKTAENILDIILPACVDTPGLIAKLFHVMAKKDDGSVSIQWLLQYLTSQPFQRYGFFFDDAFLQRVLQRHGRLFAQPEHTKQVFAAVCEANSANYIHLPRAAKYDTHVMLLEGALVHNMPTMCMDELKQLQNTDARRFAKDPFVQNASVLAAILNATPETLEASLTGLKRLSHSESEVVGFALAHVANVCQSRLPVSRFLEVIWMVTEKHNLSIEDRWAQAGIEHYLAPENPDFEALVSWLQYCQDNGWAPEYNTIAYANWCLSLHGELDLGLSLVENAMKVSEETKETQREPAAESTELRYETSKRKRKLRKVLTEQRRYWLDIRRMYLLESWEKRWLMETVILRLDDGLGSKDQRIFDDMFFGLRTSNPEAMWTTFAKAHSDHKPSLPALRLAIVARLRMDGTNLNITEELVDKAMAAGHDINDLLEPLLQAQVEREDPHKPGPAAAISEALRKGYRPHDLIYNLASRVAFSRKNVRAVISICKNAAVHNGDGNLLYCAHNFSNLLRSYVTILAFEDLSKLLSMLIEQNPTWINRMTFKIAFKNALGVMASQVLAKQEKRSKAIATKCRDMLMLLTHVRKSLRYDKAGQSQPRLDLPSTAEELRSSPEYRSSINDAEIASLSPDSPRQTWLWSAQQASLQDEMFEDADVKVSEDEPGHPDPINDSVDAFSGAHVERTAEPFGRETMPQEQWEIAEQAVEGGLDGGQVQVLSNEDLVPAITRPSSQPVVDRTMHEWADQDANAASSFTPVPDDSRGIQAWLAEDLQHVAKEFSQQPATVRSESRQKSDTASPPPPGFEEAKSDQRIQVPSVEDKMAAGRRSSHQPADAPSVGGWADEVPEKKSRPRKTKKAKNRFSKAPSSQPTHAPSKLALKSKSIQQTWGWEEKKKPQTAFDRMAASRRLDQPSQYAESSW